VKKEAQVEGVETSPVETPEAPVETVNPVAKVKTGGKIIVVANGDSWRSLADAHAPKGANRNEFAALLCEANLCAPLREGARIVIPGSGE
jgi:hypothetical protein